MATSRTLPRPTGRPRAGVRPVYEDFQPTYEWKEEEDSNILLLIHLPGFQTRDLKVSTEGRNIIRVRGERLVAGNKWSRFQEDFPVPSDCIMTGIRAKFDSGILTITIPRKKKQVQEATPSTTIPSQTTTENLTSKPQLTPIGGQIRQPTPYKRADDPTVLDHDHKLTKENQDTQEEKRPTLEPFLIGRPTPLKRATDEERVLDDHETETKDNQKLLEEKRPTLDPFQIRKPTPMRRANEKRVLENHERETKDNEKLLEEKRPTLDPFQIRKPTPMKRGNDDKRVLGDHDRETKDYEKLLEEKRPTLDPFQIRKPNPMKLPDIDEQRNLDDHDRETKDNQKLLEEKRPTLDPFQIRKPTPKEKKVLDDHESETKDHQKLLEEKRRPTLDPFQIRKPTPIIRANEQRFLDDQETIKSNNQKRPIAIKPILEKRPNYINQNALDDDKLATKDETKINPLGKNGKFEQQDVDEHDHKVDGTKHEDNNDGKSRIIHKDKDDEDVFLKKSKQIEASKKRAKGASSSVNDDQIMGINYKKKVRSFLVVNEERQLLVNMGVAVLVLVALGVQISHTIGSSREPSS